LTQQTQRRVPTFSLTRGSKTPYWVGVSSDLEMRVSPNGANSMGVPVAELRGHDIASLESIMEKKGFRLVKVGKVKIWFEKME
jgi:hypothetical protein